MDTGATLQKTLTSNKSTFHVTELRPRGFQQNANPNRGTEYDLERSTEVDAGRVLYERTLCITSTLSFSCLHSLFSLLCLLIFLVNFCTKFKIISSLVSKVILSTIICIRHLMIQRVGFYLTPYTPTLTMLEVVWQAIF